MKDSSSWRDKVELVGNSRIEESTTPTRMNSSFRIYGGGSAGY